MTPKLRRGLWAGAAGLLALLLIAPFAILTAVDSGAADGLVMRGLSAKLQRPVRFSHLHAHLISGDPYLVLENVVVGSPRDITPDDLLHARRLTAHLRLGDLAAGRFAPTTIALETIELRLVRAGAGRNNYTLGKGGAGGLLQTCRSLSITDGHVWMVDPERQSVLVGTVSHDGRSGLARPFAFDARGAFRSGAVVLTIRGGPLNGRKPDAPWPLDATLVDGDTRLVLAGSSAKPFDFRGFDVIAHSVGPNLADIGYLVNADTPNSPPFVLAAHVVRRDHTVSLTRIVGHIGGSDVTGELTSGHAGDRRTMTAAIHAGVLQAADVSALLEPAPPHAVTRLYARRATAPPKARKPSSAVPLRGLRQLDGGLDLTARRVFGYVAPLYDLSLRARLKAGRLAVTPVSFGLAPGRVAGAMTLDAVPDQPRWTISGRVAGARLGALKPALARMADGDLDVWADLRGTGGSAEAAAASATGRAAVRINRGRIQKAPAAILGGDLFQAVGLALGDKSAQTPLNCAVGEFSAARGVLTAQRLVVVTGAGAAQGSGGVDLGRQSVEITLKGLPTRRRLLHVDAPVTVTGPLIHPKVDLDKGRVLRQAGVAGALAVVATPLAAVLPFLGRTGQAPDCAALLAEAGRYVDAPQKP